MSVTVQARTPVVLVVEDEAPLLRLLTTALRAEGYDVIPVGSAEDARSSIADVRPDLVIADVHLPGMDGTELAEELRHGQNTADVPVVLISAYGRPEHHLATRFVSKPFELTHLESIVRDLVHRN